eukprot:scaffold9.g3261.t1
MRPSEMRSGPPGGGPDDRTSHRPRLRPSSNARHNVRIQAPAAAKGRPARALATGENEAAAAARDKATDGSRRARLDVQLAPTVHNCLRQSDGSVLLLEVIQSRLPESMAPDAVLRQPLHTVPIACLTGEPAAAVAHVTGSLPATPPRAGGSRCFAAAVHGADVEGAEGATLPLFTLTAADSSAHKGTPMAGDAAACALLAALVNPVASAELPVAGVQSTTGDSAEHDSFSFSPPLVDSAQSACWSLNGSLSNAASALTDSAADSEESGADARVGEGPVGEATAGSEPDQAGCQLTGDGAPAAGVQVEGTEQSALCCSAALPLAAVGGCTEQSEEALDVQPAVLMFTTTAWARMLWREGFLDGIKDANAALIRQRPTLVCGVPHAPIPLDPNCGVLAVLMFETPLMPGHLVAGAARFADMVLASPVLAAVACEQGVLRLGLWVAPTPLGPRVISAPLPLKFDGAGNSHLLALFIACCFHEANRDESAYVAHSFGAGGETAMVEGKWMLHDLRAWLSAATGGPVSLEAAAASAAAAM